MTDDTCCEVRRLVNLVPCLGATHILVSEEAQLVHIALPQCLRTVLSS